MTFLRAASRWARSTTFSAIALSASSCGVAGSFSLLTYNVAGLPEGISGSHPEHNTPLMGPLISKYDVVAVQEDFTYHDALAARSSHPYKSEPKVPTKPVGDGLNVFSRFPLDATARSPWETCFGALDHGSDCLSEKGFAITRLTLEGELRVTLVNLHMDAGRDDRDREARSRQVDQLLSALTSSTARDALIVAGDTNLKADTPDSALLDRLLTGGGLTDVCRRLACGDERIDRVMLRDGDGVKLTATSWGIADELVDESGVDLSDHEGVRVAISYESD
ncbi:MAG: endonuclease/exonuclease/phosphatase family protein [Deltaproteobacteria bacterium]|nr:endonuclease/exonuclease/phosphatase family protein [Deltaproteobacteria bacterium]